MAKYEKQESTKKLLTTTERKELNQMLMNRVGAAVAESLETLSIVHGDPESFRKMVRQALFNKPELLGSTPEQKRKSFNILMQCCYDGLVPDGRQAAMYTDRSGNLHYLPMKEGLMMLARKALNASIRGGYVCEKDVVTVSQCTGEDDTVTVVEANYFGDRGKVVGAWAWIKIPGETAIAHTINAKDIANARKKSKTVKDDSPWKMWEGAMATKTAIKGLMNQVRYMFPKTPKADALKETLDADSDYNVQTIDVEAEPLDELDDARLEVKTEPENPNITINAAPGSSGPKAPPDNNKEAADGGDFFNQEQENKQ